MRGSSASTSRGCGPTVTINVQNDGEALIRYRFRSPARIAALLDNGVPFLSGYPIHIADKGWVWYFSTLAGGGKPRVRAGDGAVWPYPRSR